MINVTPPPVKESTGQLIRNEISVDELENIVDNATDSATERSMLKMIFNHESYMFKRGGENFYSIEREGTFRGLGQFSEATWNLLFPHGLAEPYSMVGTPTVDVKATLLLLRDSAYFHKRNFGEKLVDGNIAYLYHNQGAPGAASFLRTGVLVEPGQSQKALDTFSKIQTGENIYG